MRLSTRKPITITLNFNHLAASPCQVMSYLHDRGVKGYVAMNVLVFDEELPRAEARIHQMAAAGVDAVIVQACYEQ